VKKVCYIISDINKALSFEWIASHFRDRVDLSFILIGKPDTALHKFLIQLGVKTWVVDHASYRTKFQKFVRVRKLLKQENPEIVHCHLWTAMLVGLSSSWSLGIKRRIFTRHHALIHHIEFPSGKKWDQLCNYMATDIIAISERMRGILVEKERASPEKITVINHGFDLNFFEHADDERAQHVRNKYGIPHDKKIIGVIGRYIKSKGITFIIEAFRGLRARDPEVHLVLANARGPYAKEIRSALDSLPPKSFTEIEFEDDLPSLYKIFSVYVHTPTDIDAESFGQTYIEALAAGIPSVFTIAGVAAEFIHHEQNALVVAYQNAEQIKTAVIRLLQDKELSQKLVSNGKHSVTRFSLQKMLAKLEALYA
jgi:glycosyltransferase involved in cell wall biosynthesis